MCRYASSKSNPTRPDKQSAAASASQATPATKQPKVNLPPPRAPAPLETAEQSPEVKSLRAAIEASLNFLEHGFAAEAFGALQSALKPGAPELDPNRYMHVGEVSTLIADAHKLITTADGDPTVGLEKLAEAVKLWPDKDSPYAATTKTQAAADRFKLEAYWRTKDFPKVYELSWYVIPIRRQDKDENKSVLTLSVQRSHQGGRSPHSQACSADGCMLRGRSARQGSGSGKALLGFRRRE